MFRLCCVLGSGGHTTEMLRLVCSLDSEVYRWTRILMTVENSYCYYYSPRTYVLATSDRLSEAKLVAAEAGRAGQYSVVRVARAREVGQVGAVSLYCQLTLLVLCCRVTPASCCCYVAELQR